ncbi:MAG: class I SAM-dependent methyltransferase [Gemmataceae bacterium]
MRAWIAGRTRTQTKKDDSFLNENYLGVAPSPQHALDLFDGEWTSRLPAPLNELKAGNVPLFQDHRAAWGIRELGGVAGQSVLELGPLEGGHSAMLEQAGGRVLAVEANRRAYLRCLVTKELLGLSKARFLLGDFMPFLRDLNETFDVCWASGVLYHQVQPAELIALARQSARKLFLWTHYYDHRELAKKPSLFVRFNDAGKFEYKGFRHRLHRFEYGEGLAAKSFCGGSAAYGHWLTRDDLLACLTYFGWHSIRVGEDVPDHPNGPCLTLIAE